MKEMFYIYTNIIQFFNILFCNISFFTFFLLFFEFEPLTAELIRPIFCGTSYDPTVGFFSRFFKIYEKKSIKNVPDRETIKDKNQRWARKPS